MQMDLLNRCYKMLKWRSSPESTSVRRLASDSALRLTKKRSWRLASVWLSFVISLLGCGRGNWDLSNETDRKIIIQEIRNALTAQNCASALEMSKLLFESPYTDNNIRLLYASAQGCNIGISMYNLVDDLQTADFSSIDAIFKTMVRLFPSKLANDSRYESAVIAQDILQSALLPGTVVSTVDRTFAGTQNPGSVRSRDRAQDANIFLAFTSMATVGTGLNRWGYNAATDPATLGYAQQQNLPWNSLVTLRGDSTRSSCAIPSGLLNMLDAIQETINVSPGPLSNALTAVIANLQNSTSVAAHASCDAHFTVAECDAGLIRLRYHDACWEQDPAAWSALGILNMINMGWL